MSSHVEEIEQSAAASWKVLMTKGVTNAISGLSQMCEAHIRITSIEAEEVPVVQIPDLLGGPEAMVAGVYLEMSGAGTGHIVIVYMPETAFDLIDMLMGEPKGTTAELEEMERSVLGEVGNVMGSQFLGTVADATGFDLRVSPPAVMNDMSASILDATMADLLGQSDEVLILNTTFGTEDHQINGTFLAMPNVELQNLLFDKLN
ncbi:MAG: chemotaxis protein CheC [SAR202 cluster bacterium]|jgi:chemotaxis protein CheC|nr:chemotaxis protein CheC [SAR202 cluster bacterium]MDP6713062.1 chemotaxis protein CheC [SAR202 cluster bacterium]